MTRAMIGFKSDNNVLEVDISTAYQILSAKKNGDQFFEDKDARGNLIIFIDLRDIKYIKAFALPEEQKLSNSGDAKEFFKS